jgi:mannitol-specific phosphotransferase system IIBC component
MSNIDTNIANRVIIIEHLNHLPPIKLLIEPYKALNLNQIYP